jgi:hypothetical protein
VIQRSIFDELQDFLRRGLAAQTAVDETIAAINREIGEGEALRDRGVDRVWDNAGEKWRAEALEAIALCAAAGEPFTAEDIRAIVGDPPHHHNAFGAAFALCARRGIIRKVGYRKATRASLHATELAEWIGVKPSPGAIRGRPRAKRRQRTKPGRAE